MSFFYVNLILTLKKFKKKQQKMKSSMQLPRKKIPLFFSLSTFLLFFAFIAKKSPVHQIRTETPQKVEFYGIL